MKHLFTILTLIFVSLKLTNNIDWSWWYVFMPTIIEISLFLLILTTSVLIAKIQDKKYRKNK